MANNELACVYAALILHDDGVEVTVRAARPRAWVDGWRSGDASEGCARPLRMAQLLRARTRDACARGGVRGRDGDGPLGGDMLSVWA